MHEAPNYGKISRLNQIPVVCQKIWKISEISKYSNVRKN